MDNAIAKIHQHYGTFSAVEKRIADYILQHPHDVIYMTTALLASQLQISQGSIINFANTLGFKGFSKLKLNIAQNLPEQAKTISEEVTPQDSPRQVLCRLAESISDSFQRTLAAAGEETMAQAVRLLSDSRRIEFYGVGSSSMVANDAYYRFMRLGLPAYCVTDAHIASVSASTLGEGCVVVAISHSGRTVETIHAAEIAKSRGAAVIALTSYADSPLAALSDVALVSATQEADHFREATASRYSQLLILDALLLHLSLRNVDQTLDRLDQIAEIIGEHRVTGPLQKQDTEKERKE